MKVALLLLVVALFGSVYSSTINAVHEGEFDIIYLDEPAWVHALHYNPISSQFYAYGESTFRQINHNEGVFQAVDNYTLPSYNAPYFDVRIFAGTTNGNANMYMIGPTNYQAGNTALNVGYFLPLHWAGPNGQKGSYQGDHRGYTFYAVSVDSRNFPNVIAYFVGWGQGPFSNIVPNVSVALVVVRAKFDFTVGNAKEFTWHRDNDVAVLWTDEYRPYHATYRPYIIHDYTQNKVLVVDPGTAAIWSCTAPADGVSEMIPGGKFSLEPYGRLTGVNWHQWNEVLFLGFAPPVGQGNGTLLAVHADSLTVVFIHKFAAYHTNPRAIAGQNTTLYIGFEGGPNIVKFDTVLQQVVGQARLPEQLWQVYSAWDAGYDHIYFSTWEQHSKVFRLHKNDFCSSACAFDGFCQAGVCKCPPNTVYNAKTNFCEFPRPPTNDNGNNGTSSDKGAAIAMGVLFALTFIAAVAGWVIVYRKSRGYEKLLG